MNGILRSASDRIWAATRDRLAEIIYANGGLGDELMLTAVVRAARRHGAPQHVLTSRPEVWVGNDDPLSVQTGVERWHYGVRRGWLGTTIRHLAYVNGTGRHIAQQMADHIGVALPVDWCPILKLGSHHPRMARRLVVQNSCRGALYSAVTKEWPLERWHGLVVRLKDDFEIVQVGTRLDPPLPGVQDLRGQTNLREVAGLLAQAACFVGMESGLMHVAAAVGTPAVIIYGGRSRPQETGYPFHRHLVRQPSCAGCGLNDGCPHQMVCMDIPVDECERAIRDVLASRQP